MTNIKVLYATLSLTAIVVCSVQCQDNTGSPQMGGIPFDLQQQGAGQDPSQMLRSSLGAFSNWVSTVQQRSQEQLQQLKQSPQVQQMVQQLQQQLVQQLQQQPQLQNMMQQLRQQPQVQQIMQQPKVQEFMQQLQQEPQMQQFMQQLQQQQQQDPTQQQDQFSASRLTQQQLSRRKRAIDSEDGDSSSNSNAPVIINLHGGSQARSADSEDEKPQIQLLPEDVAAYDASIEQQESQLQQMMRQIQLNMPNSEQMIQLLTAVLTLALMLQFGPSVGTNIPLIQSVVRQLVPMLVAAATFASDQGSSVMDGGAQAGPNGISGVPLQPVAAPSSPMGQAF